MNNNSGFVHLVTLKNRAGDERLITVVTRVNSFAAISQAVTAIREAMSLQGYGIYEALPVAF